MARRGGIAGRRPGRRVESCRTCQTGHPLARQLGGGAGVEAPAADPDGAVGIGDGGEEALAVGAPHLVQKAASGGRGVPHFVQNCPAMASEGDAVD